MCEHEFDEFVVGKPTTWGLQALRLIDMCVLCGMSRYELNLKQQLAAANARVAELEKELSIEKAHREKLLDEKYDEKGICLSSRLFEAEEENKRMREALEKIISVTSKCLSHEEMKDKMKGIAKAALEGK